MSNVGLGYCINVTDEPILAGDRGWAMTIIPLEADVVNGAVRSFLV